MSPTVAVVYPFFAHYRAPVITELHMNGRHVYVFHGADRDPTNAGIEAWKPEASDPYIFTPVHVLPGGFLIQRGIASLSFRHDIDVIIFLGDYRYLTTWLAAVLARLFGKRVLFWTHGWRSDENGVKAVVRRLFYRLAHGLLLYGSRAKRIGVRKGFPARTLYVIFNSLDYTRQRVLRQSITHEQVVAVRSDMFDDANRPVVLFIGRLTAAKRVDMLLEAAAILGETDTPVNLLVIGDGPDLPRLQRLAEARSLDVRFLGPCYSEDELSLLISSANVTVVPGSIGLTAIHSLGYGTPVISHDNANQQMPEWEAIRPGENGSLFRQGDVEDLARAIQNWTSTPFTQSKVRQRCWESIERYYVPDFQREEIDRAVEGLSPTL